MRLPPGPGRWPFRVRLAALGLLLTVVLAGVGWAQSEDGTDAAPAATVEATVSDEGATPMATDAEPSGESVAPTETPAAAAPGISLDLENEESSLASRVVSLLGVFVLIGLCWVFSSKRRRIDWRLVGVGIGLQFIFAMLVLWSPPGRWLFDQLNGIIVGLLGFTYQGAAFIFGSFRTNSKVIEDPLMNFGFVILPTIIFFSSLMTVLYYFGVMQAIVKFFAVIMQKTMRVSGAESLSAAANIFVGQTEAPLVIRPYVSKMTMSELMAVMTGGFATVAGGVLAAYVSILRNSFPTIGGHLITASVMSAPAALVAAKIMLPETDEPLTRGEVKLHVEQTDVNVVDAAARGAGDGLMLALNVGAMLLAFIALVAMVNFGFRWFGDWTGIHGLSLEALFGYAFWPIAWIMGVPAEDCSQVATLLGIKMVVNELVAYQELAKMLTSPETVLHKRSIIIAIYSLCGFANFSSIAIQIGGIGGIAPTRRSDLARVGVRAMFAGTFAAFMTATIAGVLL